MLDIQRAFLGIDAIVKVLPATWRGVSAVRIKYLKGILSFQGIRNILLNNMQKQAIPPSRLHKTKEREWVIQTGTPKYLEALISLFKKEFHKQKVTEFEVLTFKNRLSFRFQRAQGKDFYTIKRIIQQLFPAETFKPFLKWGLEFETLTFRARLTPYIRDLVFSPEKCEWSFVIWSSI